MFKLIIIFCTFSICNIWVILFVVFIKRFFSTCLLLVKQISHKTRRNFYHQFIALLFFLLLFSNFQSFYFVQVILDCTWNGLFLFCYISNQRFLICDAYDLDARYKRYLLCNSRSLPLRCFIIFAICNLIHIKMITKPQI